MNTYIALFRGINVGGKNLLAMKELVEIFEATGFENIQTYIQSGNVVFQSKTKIGNKSTIDISNGVLKKKGFEPRVLLLDEEQLQDAIRKNPFSTNIGKALHFFFYESQSQLPNIEKLRSIKADSEEFKFTSTVFYLFAPEGVGRSKLAATVEKIMGVPVTARNWNTVSKLATMAEMASL